MCIDPLIRKIWTKMISISFTERPIEQLKSFTKGVAGLSSHLPKVALDAGYAESARQLAKRYDLPNAGYSRKSKPSIPQVLRTTDSILEALDEPISLLRFVSGSKKMRLKGVSIAERKGLKISLFPGICWRTKKAYSANVKGNMHLFIRRKVDGKYRMKKQNVPSAFNVLTHEAPMKSIEKHLLDVLEIDTFEFLRKGSAP